jgi:hypothetical protein
MDTAAISYDIATLINAAGGILGGVLVAVGIVVGIKTAFWILISIADEFYNLTW